MKKIALFSVFVLLLCSFDEPRLSRKNLLKGVSMLIPNEFVIMPDAEIAVRLPSNRKPLAVYTDKNYEVTLTINSANAAWEYKDLALLQKFYKSSIQSMFVNLDMKQEGIKQAGKYQFVFFEFVGVVNSESKMIKRGQAVYNYMFYTVSEGNVLVFNFHCPHHLKDQWKNAAKKMMESIQIAAEPAVAR